MVRVNPLKYLLKHNCAVLQEMSSRATLPSEMLETMYQFRREYFKGNVWQQCVCMVFFLN